MEEAGDATAVVVAEGFDFGVDFGAGEAELEDGFCAVCEADGGDVVVGEVGKGRPGGEGPAAFEFGDEAGQILEPGSAVFLPDVYDEGGELWG